MHFLPISSSPCALSGCWGFAVSVDPFVLLSGEKQDADNPSPAESHGMHSWAIGTCCFLKAMGWLWSCTQHTQPPPCSSWFDPRMGLAHQRIKYPAQKHPFGAGEWGMQCLDSWIMVSYCQERASMGEEPTGFPWRKQREWETVFWNEKWK